MFVTCGEALWDLFAVEESGGLRFEAVPGGSPFNVAVGLARLGQPVALLAGMSTDPLGARLAARLEAEGVSKDLLVRSARPSGVSIVDVGEDGTPSFAIHGADAADRALTPAGLPALGPGVTGLHAGSFAAVVEPVGAAVAGLFEREAGRRLVSLDPNVRLGVEPDAALWRCRIERLAALADVVKASEEDIAALRPGEDAATVAARWRASGAGLVVVTRGAAGAEAFGAFGRVAVPALPVAVADTVGAGDAFMAALLAGLAARGVADRAGIEALDRDALEGLLARASAAAALTCTRRGAEMPRREDVETMMEEPC